MNIREKIRRNNLALNLTTGILALGLTGYAAAANDYDRIRKDISVMVGIVKSAFEHTDECKRCSVSINGHYLADQGIVFDVTPGSNRTIYAMDGEEFEFHTGGVLAGIPAIPGIVADALADVQITLDNTDFTNYTYIEGGDWSELGERVREQLHEARIQMREIERELRVVKLESMNADEAARKELANQEKELAKQMEEMSSKEKALSKEMKEKLEKLRAEKEARLAERRAEQQARFEQIETIVLNTFCDYSRTMRSLPKGERVSIIMKQARDESKIYVLERDDMESCDSAKTDLRRSALSYAF